MKTHHSRSRLVRARHLYPMNQQSTRVLSRLYGLSVSLFMMLWSTSALAQLSVSTLEPNYIEQGTQQEFTLFGRGFDADTELRFEVSPGQEAEVRVTSMIEFVSGADVGDSRGDRLVFTAQAEVSAAPGSSNLVVTTSSESRTKYAALNIRPGTGGSTNPNGNSGDMDPNGNMSPDGSPGSDGNMGGVNNSGSLYEGLPDRVMGQINAVTRASPPKGEAGGQVNLWIEGREFPSDLQVKFGTTKIEPAINSNNEPIPSQVFRNTSDTGGEMDGILYYARIGLDAPLGPVTITLQSPSTGVSYVAEDIFEIVEQGQGLIFDERGAEDIETVSSASPTAVRAGRNTAMWLLGTGFNIESRVEYSNPAVQQVRSSEVVISAQNAPGYDGIRSYLQIPPTATPGMVSATVTNPNGTSTQGIDLFEIIPPANVEGMGGTPVGVGGTCQDTDFDVVISEIVASDPNEVFLGQETDLKIFARGLACNASFLLYGGGIEVLTEPRVFQDQSDPTLRFFQLRIKVNANAPLGPRSVTILNPNGSSKSRDDAFTVLASSGATTGASCRQGQRHHSAFALIFVLLSIMISVKRRYGSI